jgi:hypothetical protein
MGLQRARVGFSDSDTPTGSVEGSGELSFEPLRDMQGNPTMLVNSAFGMGPNSAWGAARGMWRPLA